jgi:hypothetical protein
MKITREQLRTIVGEVLQEEKDYQSFFKAMLKKHGVSSPDEFKSDEEKKAFFNKVEDTWKGVSERLQSIKEDELTAKQQKIDLNKNGKVDGDDLSKLRAGAKTEAELSAAQQKIDLNKNGKVDGDDLSKLRAGAKTEGEESTSLTKILSKEGETLVKSGAGKMYNITKVNEDYDGPAVLKTGDKNALKVGEKITINSGGKKKEYKVVKSNGNGDFVLHLVESVNEGKLNEEAKPILKPGTKVKLRGGKSGKIVRFDGKTPGSPFYIVDIGQYYSIEVPAYELETESVNEGVSSADMDKIKGAVEAAKSFMNVGAELKKLGMKYTFATEPLPIYIIQPTPNNRVAIVNKKYVSKPDFVVGDIAVGIMEGKSVTEATHGDAPGQWVGFLSNQHGKKLMGTLKSATEAKKWLTRNQNYILSRFKADSVGIMTKKQWDEREAKYAFESVNEIASRTAMEIGALTGTNKDFIQNFVDKNELDIEKVFQYVKKGKLKDRMDFVTAVVGKPNNPFQVKLIKQFKK